MNNEIRTKNTMYFYSEKTMQDYLKSSVDKIEGYSTDRTNYSIINKKGERITLVLRSPEEKIEDFARMKSWAEHMKATGQLPELDENQCKRIESIKRDILNQLAREKEEAQKVSRLNLNSSFKDYPSSSYEIRPYNNMGNFIIDIPEGFEIEDFESENFRNEALFSLLYLSGFLHRPHEAVSTTFLINFYITHFGRKNVHEGLVIQQDTEEHSNKIIDEKLHGIGFKRMDKVIEYLEAHPDCTVCDFTIVAVRNEDREIWKDFFAYIPNSNIKKLVFTCEFNKGELEILAKRLKEAVAKPGRFIEITLTYPGQAEKLKKLITPSKITNLFKKPLNIYVNDEGRLQNLVT